MATQPHARIILSSSPMGKWDAHYDAFEQGEAYRGRFHSLSGSYDPAFARFRIGAYLQVESIADLIPELESGDPESLDTFLINHSAGISVLLAPPSPETAE